MKKTLLMILDGWGIGTKNSADAIKLAPTPFYDYYISSYPHSTLETFGTKVGLPQNQMGNSEVGHLNIGAGRIVLQDLMRINQDIQSGEFKQKEVLQNAFAQAEKNNTSVHFIGIFSDGGVHGHLNHLTALLKAANEYDLKKKYVHAFMDGRDTDPHNGLKYMKNFLPILEKSHSKLSTVIGRYYAMDRDNRLNRTALAYNLLVNGDGKYTDNIVSELEQAYANGSSDEFLDPIRCLRGEKGLISPGDVVIFYNFRTDRPRQLTSMLTQKACLEQGTKPLELNFITMTQYDDDFKGIKTVYNKKKVRKSIGEIISDNGLTQLRIAETEKFPHVTYFFSGGREEKFKGERRSLTPSPKVATYNLKPQMSAYQVTDNCIKDIIENSPDFICLNYANPDMVGHTGDLDAAIKACTTVDRCMGQVTRTALDNDYNILIIADHGNADYMINEDGSPNTAHTKNLVPCILLNNEKEYSLLNGKLADIAPTLLQLMGLEKAEEMTGKSLIKQ